MRNTLEYRHTESAAVARFVCLLATAVIFAGVLSVTAGEPGVAPNHESAATPTAQPAQDPTAPPVTSRDSEIPKSISVDLTPKTSDKPGEALKIDLGLGVTMELVWMPAGEFNMGADNGYANEKPVHPVKIPKGFWMGRFEVTQAQWERIMNNRPGYFKGENLPVEQVSWHDSLKFIEMLNGMVEGGKFRLPTEAEWEYACRAGTTNHYSFGGPDEDLFKFGNYCDASNTDNLPWQDKDRNDGNDGSAPVGSYKPNPWGLYDMHGNVWEWCQDWYGETHYTESALDNPVGPTSGTARVLRGGSWFYNAGFCRSSFRSSCIPVMRSCNIGFRVVCSR